MKTLAKTRAPRTRKETKPALDVVEDAATDAPDAVERGFPATLLTLVAVVAAAAAPAAAFLLAPPLGAAVAAAAALVLLALVVVLTKRIAAIRADASARAARIAQRHAETVRASNELAAQKAGTDLIMQTVTQGLFLMTPEYKIDGQYSNELETIFRTKELRLFTVLSLLERLLTNDMFNTVRDYLALLFDKTKKERTVLKVNPLAQVEVNFPNPEGGYTQRYLSFTFRRIVLDGEIARVFVAVSDVTERVELEQQLRSAENAKERQFNFLLGVLHAAPTELDDFLTSARQQLATMNAALRTQDFAAATAGQMMIFRQRLETVFRSVHALKGQAQALKFAHFVDVCHQFEGKLTALRNRGGLNGDDFLSIVLAQTELAKDIEELASVRARFVALSAAAAEGKERRATDLITAIAKLADSTAANQQKQVRVEALGFEGARLSDDVRRSLKDVLIQLTRNSVTHGIELPSERIQFGKSPLGTIAITAKIDTERNLLSLAFRDDGRGLDPEAIKAKAVAKGIVGESEAMTMGRAQAIGLIFHPGFSTADHETEDAGRGFGMNIVKEVVADRLGGKINVRSEPDRYTEFSFMIPLTGTISPSARREEVPA